MATKTQEDYLKRIEQGMQRQAAKGVAKAERGFAARGVGRLVGAGQAVGDLAAQYAQRIGETTGKIRAGAEETTTGRQFASTEAEKSRVFRAEENRKAGVRAERAAKKAKEKDVFDVIGDIF